MFIYTYNIIGEYIGFLLAALVLVLMIYSNPRKTGIFIIDKIGILTSLVSIILQIVVFYLSPRTTVSNRYLLDSAIVLFLLAHLATVVCIIAYLILLDSRRFGKVKIIFVHISVLALLYIMIFSYLIGADKMYNFCDNGVEFTGFLSTYISFGIFAWACATFTLFIAKKEMPDVIFLYGFLFAPTEIMLLVLQLKFPTIVFSSVTYVLPLCIFYMLFHSNPYDEVSGCQNQAAFEARFMSGLNKKKKIFYCYIITPQLKKLDLSETDLELEKLYSNTCRNVNLLGHRARVYRLTKSTFTIVMNMKNDTGVEDVIAVLKPLLDTQAEKASLYYKMVAFENHNAIKTASMMVSMANYLLEKMSIEHEISYYIAKDKDYIEFSRHFRIEQMLMDIRNKGDLNDERVLCYMQPIYSVSDQSFRTAEALMRLVLDGQVIYPDAFLDIAERCNCIHALTCIMLNKTCENISRLLSEGYDFDAVTINCSAIELSDKNLHKRLLDIIRRNNIEPSYIRLELTERAMHKDYDAMSHNMEMLGASGIKFYLDDFGTGYSNLEKIITCPFHIIKFDKSLLYKAVGDANVDDLVCHMVSVFKKNGFVLLVEGVEDNEQSDYSIEKGFDYIQGYKYAHPIPAAEIRSFLTKKQ